MNIFKTGRVQKDFYVAFSETYIPTIKVNILQEHLHFFILDFF